MNLEIGLLKTSARVRWHQSPRVGAGSQPLQAISRWTAKTPRVALCSAGCNSDEHLLWRHRVSNTLEAGQQCTE